MPRNHTTEHEYEALAVIPFVSHEYKVYKVERQKNRIACALAVTNLAWVVLAVVYILTKI